MDLCACNWTLKERKTYTERQYTLTVHAFIVESIVAKLNFELAFFNIQNDGKMVEID